MGNQDILSKRMPEICAIIKYQQVIIDAWLIVFEYIFSLNWYNSYFYVDFEFVIKNMLT